LNRPEILRYLSVHGEPDPETAALVDDCAQELAAAASEAYTYSLVPLRLDAGVLLDGYHLIKSHDLEAHLAECDKCAVFAATLGTSAEYLLYRYGRTNVRRAVVMHACATAQIEELCDRMENEIAEHAKAEGLFLRPRYSPGYGDFSLEHQRDIAALTQCGSRIGVGVTESLLLTPSKSVTGIIGFSKVRVPVSDSCVHCRMHDTCDYRRSGPCCK